MADPISNKGFGDATLAERILKIYSEHGCDNSYCLFDEKYNLNLGNQKDALVKELSEALDGAGRGEPDGMITDWEKSRLVEVGFSRNFLKALCGDDGAKALRRRVRWLASDVEKNERNLDAPERVDALRNFFNILYSPTEIDPRGIVAEETIPIFLRIMRNDPDAQVRLRAVETLGFLGSAAAGVVEEIIAGSRNGDISPIVTADALGRIGARPEIAIPYIFQLGKGLSFEESYPFSRAITFFGERAFPWILKGMKDESVSTRTISMDVLQLLFYHKQIKEGERFLLPLISALEDSAPEVRRKAVFALSAMGEKAYLALPILQDMTRHDPDETCRNAARDAIEQIESEVP